MSREGLDVQEAVTDAPAATTTAAPARAPLPDTAAVQRQASAARRRRRAGMWALRLLLVVVWLGSWEAAATWWIDPFFYSKPSAIWHRLVEWFDIGTQFGSVWEQILITLEEAVLGFVIGAAAGVVLGVLLGRSRYLADVLAPFIKAANAVPRIVLASLFIIWFGFGLASKVATVVVLVFFAVFFNAFTGAREVDRNLLDNARILGASRLQVLGTIVLPSATSWILSSLHTAFGFALIGAVVGEYAGASKGLGLLISNAQGTFDSAGIYAGMIIITVVALVAEWLLTMLENRLLRWRPSASRSSAEVV
ncbi:NitT/TauT family transport system permease protein [Streptoalloteichus tenebrarius]|uniref:NitT/TauT family transport system permease protein n=1 Tax=Streptoalloteichus tenebrarius (strain ATCC 17920 / DSM 40477 / JCM 4838 / CBS 697.72 / NBRC 16177 / NCIMB 11028 / NRRL B-12390 / A12253. 1 / ISP 5477) TaxID=1933 RepID=A0ABT1HWX1_STRSD|nr:ABC transporter permease [Streptoalloteichus tenebrarius]MCP2260023.1 NitT/TauT family transport system permease protein [Streptoalloteichus tenebrarius]BFF03861.1 ABC transporter permease [Streptoalloteichus tenebrarius]